MDAGLLTFEMTLGIILVGGGAQRSAAVFFWEI